MPGLFDALGTASQGLRAVQQGVSTTAHNIANVNTPGYTRQRQVLQATRPVETQSGALGTGVEQVSIERITDQFIQLRLISETSRLSSLDTLLNTHRTIESIVNDQQAAGLNDALAEFFGSFDDLASSPDPGRGP